MKFIKQELFLDYKGNTRLAGDLDKANPDRPAWNGEVIAFIADQYVPREGLTLNSGEIRKLNKAVEVLYSGITVLQNESEDGYYTLEDEHYETLKEVVLQFVIILPIWSRSTPQVEDIFDGATSQIPKEKEHQIGKNNEVKLKAIEVA